ncbi:MAG: hypothetical protein BWX50_01210 [Euryarchaeota archaeon ADurb.Bin009]|nr:MAG: hypothetical protein BWX50_01210 [Euryarchaeota archaeon ADurb.Bin009]
MARIDGEDAEPPAEVERRIRAHILVVGPCDLKPIQGDMLFRDIEPPVLAEQNERRIRPLPTKRRVRPGYEAPGTVECPICEGNRASARQSSKCCPDLHLVVYPVAGVIRLCPVCRAAVARRHKERRRSNALGEQKADHRADKEGDRLARAGKGSRSFRQAGRHDTPWSYRAGSLVCCTRGFSALLWSEQALSYRIYRRSGCRTRQADRLTRTGRPGAIGHGRYSRGSIKGDG